MVYMERIASQAIPYWKALFLQNVQQQILPVVRIEESVVQEAIESVDLAKYRDSEALEKEYQALVQKAVQANA